MNTYIIILDNGTIRQTEGKGMQINDETGQIVVFDGGNINAIAPSSAIVIRASTEDEKPI